MSTSRSEGRGERCDDQAQQIVDNPILAAGGLKSRSCWVPTTMDKRKVWHRTEVWGKSANDGHTHTHIQRERERERNIDWKDQRRQYQVALTVTAC